jgi:hypothetical protein
MKVPKIKIPAKVTRTLHKGLFQIKKHSPEILMVVGVAGGVTSAVLACKATTKAGTILEETKEGLEAIKKVASDPQYAEQYTEADQKKDVAIVCVKTGVEFAKLYGPAIALGVASIGCIFASNNIMRKRNMALSAALATEALGFKEYRKRLVERFGEELDRELKYDIKAKEIEEIVVNEDGTESVAKQIVNTANINEESDYARFFDELSDYWDKDAEYNLMFLKHQQNHANELLKSQGYLYLNDVYKMLGLRTSKAGQVVGWIYDEKDPLGDNYVDFGIYDLRDPDKRAFVNGHEKSILLDFNVDGNIWELMN